MHDIKRILFLGFFFIGVVPFTSVAASIPVGLISQAIYPGSARPLNATVWYPTEQSSPLSLIADNVVFKGTYAVKNAQPKSGKFPLVLLSHGYRGHWRNLNWLATRLVRKGYLVAAVDHPGTSTFNHEKSEAELWWERPRDVSRLLDWLQSTSQWQSSIDQSKISVIGHSLGGWTAMLLAGAEVDYSAMRLYHKKYPNPRIEGVGVEMRIDVKKPMKASLKDDRIDSFVSLDLGLAHSFSSKSLENINESVLILGAGIDIGDLPVDEESGFIAKMLPPDTSLYKVYPEATHFSFVQLCKPNAYEMLEEELPGDGIICLDGNEMVRDQMHELIFHDVAAFLASLR